MDKIDKILLIIMIIASFGMFMSLAVPIHIFTPCFIVFLSSLLVYSIKIVLEQ